MTYTIRGSYDMGKAGHVESYYSERYTFIDFRGALKISPLSYWGYCNTILTASHDISTGVWTEPMILKKVIVDDYAWITSNCILYNCHIGHHAVLSIGSVVSNAEIEPYTMVAGNPAKAIAKWDGNQWARLD